MTTVEVTTNLDQSPESKSPYPIWVEPGLLVGSFVCYCFGMEFTAFLIPMILLFFLYLPLAIHGLLHRFTLDRINGINASVVSVFLLSLGLTILAQGDFDSLETAGLVLFGLPFFDSNCDCARCQFKDGVFSRLEIPSGLAPRRSVGSASECNLRWHDSDSCFR